MENEVVSCCVICRSLGAVWGLLMEFDAPPLVVVVLTMANSWSVGVYPNKLGVRVALSTIVDTE